MEGHTQPSYGAPSATPYPTGKRPLWKTVAYGCSAGCGLLLVILVIMIITTSQKTGAATKQADLTARQFMDDLQYGEMDKAYALTSKAWRDHSSLAEFKVFAAKWMKEQGAFGIISLRDTSWLATGRGMSVNLLYDIQGKHSDGQVRMTVVPEGKGVAVQDASFTPHSVGTPP